jgi:hypothetical protein
VYLLTTLSTPPSPRDGFAPPSPQAAAHPLRGRYAELRDLICLTLVRGGRTVECAVKGPEAIKQLRTALKEYDLLITDHHMPVMNGLELVAAVRALPSTADGFWYLPRSGRFTSPPPTGACGSTK